MEARQAATEIAQRLLRAGHQAFFAGGCVRDFLLEKTPKDYDIATSARPEEVLAALPQAIAIGAHFGVMLVKHAGHAIEIATFRTDGSYRDSRRPESVEFSSPENDALRRDFTINGLFQNPLSGEILDYVGGLDDLREKTLRAIGEPEQRFSEDALRLMRAIRFSGKLNFRIEPKTWLAIRQSAPRLPQISCERIRDEFSQIITSPNRRRGIELLVESDLMTQFMPEFLTTIGCEQPPQWHPEGDVFIHTCIMLEMLDADAPLDLCLAVLLHDIGKPACRTVDETGRIRFNGHDAVGADMAAEILTRLKYPNAVIASVTEMVARHMQFMNVQKMRTSRLKQFMARPRFTEEMELHRVDCGSSNGLTDNYEFILEKQLEFSAEPLIPPPLVNGGDLISLGLRPGPAFKTLLDSVQIEQLEGRILERKTALDFLKQQVELHYSP